MNHSSLKAHTLVHSAKKTYTCEICDKTFVNLPYFKKHELSHREQIHSCDICGDIYTAMDILKTHKKAHTEERPFLCEICKKSFKNEGFTFNAINEYTWEKSRMPVILVKRNLLNLLI